MKLFVQHPDQLPEEVSTLRHTHARSLSLAVIELADRLFGRSGWRVSEDPERPCLTAIAPSGSRVFVEEPPVSSLFPYLRGCAL